MIESDIEATVKAQIVAVLPEVPADVSGAWDIVPAGEVKGHERPGNGLHLSVVVSPRAFDGFTTPTANIAAGVALKVDAAQDPTGSRFHALCAALIELLQTWQRSISAVRETFSITGFTAKGFRMDGGDVVRDTNGIAWVMTASFTLRGVVADPVPSTTPNT